MSKLKGKAKKVVDTVVDTAVDAIVDTTTESAESTEGTITVVDVVEPVVVDVVDPVKTDSITVKNISINPWAIDRTTLRPGKTYTLTERDLSDKRLLLKLENAINQGKLERC